MGLFYSLLPSLARAWENAAGKNIHLKGTEESLHASLPSGITAEPAGLHLRAFTSLLLLCILLGVIRLQRPIRLRYPFDHSTLIDLIIQEPIHTHFSIGAHTFLRQ